MKRKIEYYERGRGGHVVYKDNFGDIPMEFEYGGGNCVAIIYVPNPEVWTKVTNRPLEDRKEILTFVGERAAKERVTNGSFGLFENWIEIYGGSTS